eukprot:TRINITY_DN107533_c0_g1_i1.p1 TRINITY_DN107533_c0_g1~~TRINITY_DN107533_c0_g1_i1.p1  ORF type:complete len:108 (-),score=17.40 TRINITY_DN107533_c0_g1_i1:49-372(-)
MSGMWRVLSSCLPRCILCLMVAAVAILVMGCTCDKARADECSSVYLAAGHGEEHCQAILEWHRCIRQTHCCGHPVNGFDSMKSMLQVDIDQSRYCAQHLLYVNNPCE